MSRLHRVLAVLLFAVLNLEFSISAIAQSQTRPTPLDASPALALDPNSYVVQAQQVIHLESESIRQAGVNWLELSGESLLFLSVENAFRCATEEGTRDAVSGLFTHGYWDAVGNLHGWNDGDPFYVNYVGHPMQGSVSGYLWTHNDRAYRDIQFGRNRRYWKGKLRGAAYSYVYSVLMEIGPLSEASIGNIQAYYPQQGFVDHVVTPAIGLGWSIAEDALDRYPIRYIEAHTTRRWVPLLVRSGLNPSRSMANVLEFEPPWHRDNRPGIFSRELQDPDFMEDLDERNTARLETAPPAGVAPFEFSLNTEIRAYTGAGRGGSCIGGGSSGALRLAPRWQFLVDVGGCKLLGLRKNLSGDSLTYLAGTRWTTKSSKRLTPHVEVLVGGTKLTQELVDPNPKKVLEQDGNSDPPHSIYSNHWETNGFTIQAGGGVDVKLNGALSIRVADVDYFHSWSNELNAINYGDGLQLSGGLILRMGTW